MKSRDRYKRVPFFGVFLLISGLAVSTAFAQSRLYSQLYSQSVSNPISISVLLYDPPSGSSAGDLPWITEVNQKEGSAPYLFSYLPWSFPEYNTGYKPVMSFGLRQQATFSDSASYKSYRNNYQGYWDSLQYDYTPGLPRWGYGSSDTYGIFGNPYGRAYGLIFNFNDFFGFKPSVINPSPKEAAALECTAVTDKTGYESGEPAAITFTVTNTGGQPADLHFSSGKQYDIIIKDEAGNQVWQQSRHQFYTLSLANLVVQPGEVRTYRSQWDQKDDQGAPVSGGVYTVEAFLTPSGKDYQIGASTRLSIADLIIDESYHEKTIHISQGSLVQINLKANVSTGYQWQGEWDTSLMALHDHSYLDSPAGLLGTGGTDVWLLKALAAGETALSFTCHRPWETGVDPAQEFIVYAVIDTVSQPPDTPPALLAAPLTYTVRTDKALYSQGEEIIITFTVTNYRGAEPITLNFTSGQRFDGVVKDSAGKEIFRLSDNKFFTLSLAFIELEPGETLSFQDRWDQKDSQGSLVPPGTYTLEAFLTSSDYSGKDATTITIGEPRIKSFANSGCKTATRGDVSLSLTEELKFSYSYQQDSGILFLKHTNASFNCCIEEITVTMSIEGQVINVYEEEKLKGSGCRCMCNYDITAEVVDLPAGTYEVNFFNKSSGKLSGTIPQVIIP
ncbi:MAG: BsuPI-related putative proteinase inhibitor [bacterium]